MLETHNPTIIFACGMTGGNDSIAQHARAAPPLPSPRSRQPCRDISAKYRKPITDLPRALLHARGRGVETAPPDFTMLNDTDPSEGRKEGLRSRSLDGRTGEKGNAAAVYSPSHSKIEDPACLPACLPVGLPACWPACLPSFLRIPVNAQ